MKLWATTRQQRKKRFTRLCWTVFAVFVLMQLVAVFHAYKFTHFAEAGAKTPKPAQMTTGQKLQTVFFGISNPRPENHEFPRTAYQVVALQGDKLLECWRIPVARPRGTVVLFHGYGGSKATMLDKAEVFGRLGYETVLVDFMGSGGSEGNQTTIGFLEAKQVTRVYDYARQSCAGPVYLFGTSMGAVAIMKALQDDAITPAGVILECPFGTLYKTVCARFDAMGVPTFPMAGLLVFWGGLQNGFWGFSHNPERYALSVKCPVLLLYGQKDPRVSHAEIKTIFKNLRGPKTLKTYPQAGHENYLKNYRTQWTRDVQTFLEAQNGVMP